MFRNYWIFIIEFQILAFQTTKFSPTSSIEWKEFPFIVSLQRIKGLNELEHFCAGTILDDHWILTAAHCLQDSIVVANDIEHIVALTKLSDQRRKFESKIFRLNLALIDDRFDSNTMDNDIGLVRTIESIEFLQHRIHWNQSVIDRTVPKIASVIGWGSTKSLRSMGLFQEQKISFEKSWSLRWRWKNVHISIVSMVVLCYQTMFYATAVITVILVKVIPVVHCFGPTQPITISICSE
ncbi:hypothetical protein SSS_05978 [Sarcoptes scabiei]|nr:hypothetical protein SSS_05978 [Sarcoptes scabiei]